MKRPFPVTLTVVLVLMLAVWNALRAWTSIRWQETLVEFGSNISPVLSAAFGVLWFVIGIVVLIGIWQRKPWSGKMLIGAAAGYTVWAWSGRFLWQTPRPDIVFTIIINLACLVLIYFTSKLLTREAYERNTENPEVE